MKGNVVATIGHNKYKDTFYKDGQEDKVDLNYDLFRLIYHKFSALL